MKTLILRLEVDEAGRVLGVVERVRTGEKERFLGYPMLGDVVRHLIETDDTPAFRTTHTQGEAICRHARNRDLLGARQGERP